MIQKEKKRRNNSNNKKEEKEIIIQTHTQKRRKEKHIQIMSKTVIKRRWEFRSQSMIKQGAVQ